MSDRSTVIADAAERARAIDPDRSFIVQAPAGSGKTELLIQRFLALLGRVGRPDEILAITFTRKAAGEMRARLLQALQAARGAEPENDHERATWRLARKALERDRQCGWDLAENPSLLAIQTIDSFNASLVRRMPWLSRFGAVPTVAEDPGSLYREAAERTLARLGTRARGAGEVAEVLAHLDNRLDLLRDLLVRMLARRDQWLRHLAEKDHERWRQHLEGALQGLVEGTLATLAGKFPPEAERELLLLGRYAAANLPDSDRPLVVLAAVREFPSASAEELPVWAGLADLLLTTGGTLRRRLDKNGGFPAGKGEPAAIKKRMADLIAGLDPRIEPLLAGVRRLPSGVYPEEQWRILSALVELLPLAVAELWLVFRQEGQTDFATIAMQAGEALGGSAEPSELLLRLDARIGHILVDEFQDTSYLQSDLLERLTAGWEPGDGRTLFLVGDPMQSIYLFREAEVGLFLRARSRGLGTLRLEPLTLCSNFRSQQGVVAWVNEAFAGIFPEREDEALGAVTYAPAEAVHPLLDGPACAVYPFAERDDRAEALQVVAIVRRALDENPEGRVAVLVRGRSHLPEILSAFREASLRFSAVDIDPLESRPVVRDLLALTRALLHPDDRLSWLALLRAPWCGLQLADLSALCGVEPCRSVVECLADPVALARLSVDGRARAERARAVLARGADRRGAIGLRRLVEGTWLALGGASCVDATAAEDAKTVFALLESLDYGGDLRSFAALAERVRRLFATPDAAADERLQVMTIHKSKGLEFETVILPGLGRSPAGGENGLLRWLEHPDYGLLLAPVAPRDGRSRDPIYDLIGRLVREKGGHEDVRLLYVAATRARRRLHLLGHAKPNRDGEPQPAAGSLLQRLWPALSERFSGAAESAQDAVKQVVERPLRRLPAGWSPTPPSPAPVPVLVPRHRQGGAERQEIYSGWEGETDRHVGTVIHHYLERIARDGLERWTVERSSEQGDAICRRLSTLGVASSELAEASDRVGRALRTALTSKRGRWVLGPRAEGECELELGGVIGGEVQHRVLDRTFVDEEGSRWIVDYKSSAPRGEGEKAFLAAEEVRYREQLSVYAAFFRGLGEGRPIRAALYFPLFDGWREVPV